MIRSLVPRPAHRAATWTTAWATIGAAIGAAILAAALWVALPAGAAPGLETAQEIQDCMRGNLPERTSRQTIELTSEDRAQGRRTLEAELHWKRREDGQKRVRIRVEAPSDLRDATYLVIENEPEDDMYMYLPRLQKVRRITSGMISDSLWGTDFSYEDVRQLQGIAVDGSSERLPDGSVDGRPTRVLAVTPADPAASAYRRIVSSVDPETCVALRTELFERGDAPRKVLLADPTSIQRVEGRWIAHAFEMRDLRDETQSWLRIRSIANDVSVPDKLFNPTLMGRTR